MNNRQELREKVPHGYVKVIAEKAGVTPKSVSEFLNGKSNSAKIELATLTVLAELNQQRQALLAQIITL